MEAAATPPGGLPWEVAIPAFVAMAAAIAALWRSRGASGKHYGRLLREKDAEIAAGERRTDAVEKAFREHLEHDARLFRGERDRKPVRQYTTGNLELDKGRAHTESVSQQIPPDVMARIRAAVDRGEIPL